MECFLSFKNCALRLKTVPVCLAQLLRCQSVAMQASRLPFALNLTKTTSAIPPDRLVHWYKATMEAKLKSGENVVFVFFI